MIKNGKHDSILQKAETQPKPLRPPQSEITPSPERKIFPGEARRNLSESRPFALPILAAALALGVIIGIWWKRT